MDIVFDVPDMMAMSVCHTSNTPSTQINKTMIDSWLLLCCYAATLFRPMRAAAPVALSIAVCLSVRLSYTGFLLKSAKL